MTINIHATGIDLTEALKTYTTEKFESLEKFFGDIQQADVTIGKVSEHHQKGKVFYAEANLFVPGQKLYIRKDAEDLYKAIDKIKDHLKVDLEKMKGKMRDYDPQALRDQKGYQG